MSKISAIIPAAGQGKRMKAGQNKQYLALDGKPIVAHTLELFEKSAIIDDVILVIPEKEIDFCQSEILSKYNLKKAIIVSGGKERQDSVNNGLKALSFKTDIVVVHDGARPLLQLSTLDKSVELAKKWDGVVVAVPVKDTIKVISKEGTVESTPQRDTLFAAQTPQVFKREIICDAYQKAYQNGFFGTDDASIVEWAGYKVKIFEGNNDNIKITTPEDLLTAKAILRERGNQT